MDSSTFEAIMIAVADKLKSQAWTIESLQKDKEDLKNDKEKIKAELAEYKKAELAAVNFGKDGVCD